MFITLLCNIFSYTFCASVLGIVQIILYLMLRPLNSDLYYRINFHVVHVVLSFFVYFFDWYTESELYLHMNRNDFDKYLGKEHTYIISNHRTEIDWITILSFSEKLSLLGNSRFYIKSAAKYVPGIGLSLYVSDLIGLERDFKKDKINIEKKVQNLMSYPNNVIITLKAEGTRFTEEKHKLSLQYAKENNLPQLKYHLIPKSKGFITSLPIMRGKINAIYDLTMIYVPDRPKFYKFFMGQKIVAHLVMKRIPIEEVPKDDKEITNFMYNIFKQKDNIYENFMETGDFPNGMEKIKLEKKYSTFLIVIICNILSHSIMLYYVVKSLLNENYLVILFFLAFYVLILGISYKASKISTVGPSSTDCSNNKKEIK